jgi:hypothetical protein
MTWALFPGNSLAEARVSAKRRYRIEVALFGRCLILRNGSGAVLVMTIAAVEHCSCCPTERNGN